MGLVSTLDKVQAAGRAERSEFYFHNVHPSNLSFSILIWLSGPKLILSKGAQQMGGRGDVEPKMHSYSTKVTGTRTPGNSYNLPHSLLNNMDFTCVWILT